MCVCVWLTEREKKIVREKEESVRGRKRETRWCEKEVREREKDREREIITHCRAFSIKRCIAMCR